MIRIIFYASEYPFQLLIGILDVYKFCAPRFFFLWKLVGVRVLQTLRYWELWDRLTSFVFLRIQGYESGFEGEILNPHLVLLDL